MSFREGGLAAHLQPLVTGFVTVMPVLEIHLNETFSQSNE